MRYNVGSWAENHLSSFNCGFLNISSRQNLLSSLSRMLFLKVNRWLEKECDMTDQRGAKTNLKAACSIMDIWWLKFSRIPVLRKSKFGKYLIAIYTPGHESK